MKKIASRRPKNIDPNSADKNVVLSFGEMLRDKGFEVEYLTPEEAKEKYNHGLEEETRKLLNTEVLVNGTKITPAKMIAAGQVAYAIDNPNPAVVGQLRKNIGDDVVKMEVGGMGIDQFFNIVQDDGDEPRQTDA